MQLDFCIVTVRNVVAARLCFHRHLSFCSGGRAWQGEGVHGGGHAWQEGDACVTGETATAADGRHPTGMHSC